MIETAAVRDALFDVRIRAIASNGSGVADLPDGRVVLRPVNEGIPFLFGLGDNSGAPSGLPTEGGVTPTARASTPSGGLVPGQEPR